MTPTPTGPAQHSGRRLRRWPALAVMLLVATVLSGCASAKDGYLIQGVNGDVTTDTRDLTNMWVYTWVAALAVGVLVWGLTLWCVIAYRKKADHPGLPVQLRYNVPIEILYTVVPVFMVTVLFFYTAKYEDQIYDVSKTPDVVINVVGKQWAWDFNYVNANVYDTGEHVKLDGTVGKKAEMPVLYMPVNKRVEFVLTARDVIHSFWVPAFLVKLDMFPSKVNRLQVTATQEGEFQGKCAELCGAYHSEMLFLVKVVSQAEYDQHMADLKAKGQTGFLDNTMSREQLMLPDREVFDKVTGGKAQ